MCALVTGVQTCALPSSTGSACHAGRVELSPVLAAMGVPEQVGMGAVRFSLGRGTTPAEIDAVAERLSAIASRCIEQQPEETHAQAPHAPTGPDPALRSRPLPDRFGDGTRAEGGRG